MVGFGERHNAAKGVHPFCDRVWGNGPDGIWPGGSRPALPTFYQSSRQKSGFPSRSRPAIANPASTNRHPEPNRGVSQNTKCGFSGKVPRSTPAGALGPGETGGGSVRAETHAGANAKTTRIAKATNRRPEQDGQTPGETG